MLYVSSFVCLDSFLIICAISVIKEEKTYWSAFILFVRPCTTNLELM